MGQEALEAAIFNYRGIPLDNHDDDEGALICKCFGITDARIRRVILENDLTTAEQVTHYVKAGGGCTSCLADIDDLIAEVAEQKTRSVAMANSVAHPSRSGGGVSTAVSARPLTNLQKITLIQQILEEEVKPVLAEDGGDVELFDVSGNLVQVILKGACGSCSSSTATLKIAIEARLQERISPDIIVESV
jgi:NifU-like protein